MRDFKIHLKTTDVELITGAISQQNITIHRNCLCLWICGLFFVLLLLWNILCLLVSV